MSKLPRYESYKDSGVQWLGEIPSHWEVWKITHAMDLIGSGTTPKSDNLEYYDGDVLWVTTSELRESYIYDTKQKVTDSAIQDYSALKKYPINSIAIAMYGATIGRLGILAKEATFNQACCVFSGSKVLNHKFLYYWLWMRRPILISLSNGGGQPNLSQDDLKKLKLALPPMDEQKIIADFLDKRLAQVDALIAKQETLLEKLAEQRVALISHAVTKGLNPDVEMKESDVEWLGNIPKHWDTKKLKFSVGCNLKTLTDKTDSDYEILYVDISNVSLTAGIKNKEELLFENAPSRARRVVKSGDVLVSTVRTYLKAITYVESAEDNLIASTGFAVLSPLDILDSKFLGYWIQSEGMIGSIVANSVGVSYPAINSSVLVSLPIVDIPLEEQKAISSYLDMEIETINRQVKLVNSSIEKLKEYRSTLITQVVTGKIDVRNLKVN
ncbi:restriction endonuclease subunit S [Acinetobacter sp. YH12236]|uniref:restriction endonuclease subunit S n=1 Tax=Acinetobacter sp. YH12236 TaxID=2601163 RepID=UPI0015D41670|nr:restriction endonuclease subunit S [Acinetobacter sp. YH12236]